MPDPQILVTSPGDRPSAHDQIVEVLERARAKGEPVRVRIPFLLYDHDSSRGYTTVRDTAYNMALPSAETTPEAIERMFEAIGKCIVLIAQEGSDAMLRKLEGQS